MSDEWEYNFCAAYVVEPGIGVPNEELSGKVSGAVIEISDIPLDVLNRLFIKPRDSYPIGFLFKAEHYGDDVKQHNPIRELMQDIAGKDKEKKAESSLQLAIRLASVTRSISGVGLLVFLLGRKDKDSRLVIWKFPQEETIQARSGESKIIIQRIEDAFSTESTYVKAAILEDDDPKNKFWTGRLEDRQSKDRAREVADYWIDGFLDSRPEITGPYGTKLLCKAIRKAIQKSDDPDHIVQLVSSLISLRELDGRIMSFREFLDQTLPGDAGKIAIDSFEYPNLLDESFRVSMEHIGKVAGSRKLTLASGVIVIGPLSGFDDVITIEQLDHEGKKRITIEGKIIKQTVLAGK